MRTAPSPVLPTGQAAVKDLVYMCIPLVLMAFFFYGPRVIGLVLVGMLTAYLVDRITAGLLRKKYNFEDNTSILTALLLVLMMPVTVRFYVVVTAVALTILVGKEAFGGFPNYPFLPVAVGFCIVAVAWPSEVFGYVESLHWIENTTWNWEGFVSLWQVKDAILTDTPGYILRHGGVPQIEIWRMLAGDVAGPMGAGAVGVIIAGAVFLRARKSIPLSASASFLLTAAAVAFFFPRAPEGAWQIPFWINWQLRFQVLQYEVLTGSLFFAAVFMVNDPGILPKNRASRLIYGSLLGISTMMFRYFGTFETGLCFAFLLINAISGYFDRALLHRRFKLREKIGE